MCIFFDMFTKDDGQSFHYPSVKFTKNDDTEIVLSYVQYVYIGNKYMRVVRNEPDLFINEEVLIEGCKYAQVINK